MDHPILAADRLDYAKGSYETSVKRGSGAVGLAVGHAVSGPNLVAKHLEAGTASFAVEVASPYATYREVRLAEQSGVLHATQEVTWDADDVVQPVYVRPLVLATAGKPRRLRLNGRHGVHEVWKGVAVELSAGTILAQDRFWRASSTWQSLIRLVSNEDGTLPPGAYRVETNTSEGYHFQVQMHPDLYARMVSPEDRRTHLHGQSILTGCLARGLGLVREEFGSSGRWREEYPVLRALHDMLEEKGLPTWEDDHFPADEVASRLRPLEFEALGDG